MLPLCAFILLVILFNNCTSAFHERDQRAKDANVRASDQWFLQLGELLKAQPSDSEAIYQVLVKGLLCNHHRVALHERQDMETILVIAIGKIKKNRSIFKKMMTNPKKTINPFQQLYRWNSRMRFALEDVAEQGEWDMGRYRKIAHRSAICYHQDILLDIKANTTHHQNHASDFDDRHRVLQTLNFTTHFLNQLTEQRHSILYVEIALTFFQLIMDIRSYLDSIYDDVRIQPVYKMMVQCLATLTMGDLNQMHKLMDIVLDKAPDMMTILWDQRQHHLRHGMTTCPGVVIRVHQAEHQMYRIEKMEERASTLTRTEITERLLCPCTKYYQNKEKEVKERKEKGLAIMDVPSAYYFEVLLLNVLMNFVGKMQRIDPCIVKYAYVAEMIRCTAEAIVPFQVDVANTIEGLLRGTFSQIMTEFRLRHTHGAHAYAASETKQNRLDIPDVPIKA